MTGTHPRRSGPPDPPATDWYAQWRAGEPSSARPRRVTLELTSRCMLRCVMCPRNHLPRGEGGFREGDMEPALFRRLVDEMAAWPAHALVPFFRGEPLLHPRALELLGYAVERGIRPIQMATNAVLLTAEVADRLLALDLDFVSFSLDAHEAQDYERLRRGARHAEVMAQVDDFLARRTRRPAGRLVVQVSTVARADERDRVEQFVRHWRGRVDRVRVYPEHSAGGRYGRLSEGRPAGARRPCLKPLTDAVVLWDGTLALCNHDWVAGAELGDVRARPIEEAWSGPAYRRVREAHAAGAIPEELPCAACDHWAAYSRDGDLMGELYE